MKLRASRGLKPSRGEGASLSWKLRENLAAVRNAVQANRQRLSVAKAELETELGKNFSTRTLERYIKNLVQVINASEKRPRYQTDPASYGLKLEGLRELEELSQAGHIDLYYGDESRVNMEPCIPYGWQFKNEDVFMPSEKGKGLNLFGLLSRDNRLVFKTTRGKVNSNFVIAQLGKASF